jgi:hypothetical protein
MAFTDQYALARPGDATSTTFQKQVHIAMCTAATLIVGEDKSTMTNADWQKRHRYGVAILNDPDSYIQRFLDAVVTNAALGATPSDNDVQFTVNSVFGDLAGVGQADWL